MAIKVMWMAWKIKELRGDENESVNHKIVITFFMMYVCGEHNGWSNESKYTLLKK